MRRLIFTVIIILAGCFQPQETQPDSVTVDTMIDTTAGLVGDIFHYQITIDGLDGKYVTTREIFPPGAERRSQDSYRKDHSRYLKYEIVYWDTGQQVIPPQEIQVYNADSTLYGTFKTDPIFITIGSVLTQDNANTLKPIKPPVPVAEKPDIKTIAAILLVILLVAGIYWIWRKREITQQRIAVQQTYIPPDERALDLLATLKKNQHTDIKEWYTALSHILREYVENSFFIRALEMTTEEIREHKNLLPIDAALVADFIGLLQKADQVKYARAVPDLRQMEADIATGIDFVHRTIPAWKSEEQASS